MGQQVDSFLFFSAADVLDQTDAVLADFSALFSFVPGNFFSFLSGGINLF
jgi:hypothetical protein